MNRYKCIDKQISLFNLQDKRVMVRIYNLASLATGCLIKPEVMYIDTLVHHSGEGYSLKDSGIPIPIEAIWNIDHGEAIIDMFRKLQRQELELNPHMNN